MKNKKWFPLVKIAAFVIVGAILGFSYYHFIGCRSGACPITSNPWISTGYGAVIGALFSMSSSKSPKTDPDADNK